MRNITQPSRLQNSNPDLPGSKAQVYLAWLAERVVQQMAPKKELQASLLLAHLTTRALKRSATSLRPAWASERDCPRKGWRRRRRRTRKGQGKGMEGEGRKACVLKVEIAHSMDDLSVSWG